MANTSSQIAPCLPTGLPVELFLSNICILHKSNSGVTFVENLDGLYYHKPPVVQTLNKKTASFDPENNFWICKQIDIDDVEIGDGN